MQVPRNARATAWVFVVAAIVGVGCGGSVGGDEAGVGGIWAALGGEPSTGGASGGGGASQPSTGGRAGAGGTGGTGGTGGGEGHAGSVPFLFSKLDFDGGPGDGYCIQTDEITSAAIIYNQLGDYWITADVFRGWVDDPACPALTSDSSCHVTEPFRFQLSANQIAELGALLDALPVDRCEIDPMLACDPCLIATVDTDWEHYSDYCCGTQLSPGYDEAFTALADFLDGLVPNHQ